MAEVSTQWFLKNYEKLCAKAKAEMAFDRWHKNEIGRKYAEELGWYDWFCKESALIGRTLKYGNNIKTLVKNIPILGKNTFVSFSQRYGRGYVDYFHIFSPTKMEFGYGIRVDEGGYYVYRGNRDYGADFKSTKFYDVVNFIKKDVIIWLGGGATAEYRGYTNQEPVRPSYTQSRIKATKSFGKSGAVADMYAHHLIEVKRKSKRRK